MIGRVVSAKQPQTVTVLLETTKRHPLYKKTYKSSKRYLVDDQIGVKLGDVVEFVKVRPISKRKHWQITKVVGQDIIALGKQVMKEVAEEAIEQVLPEESKQELSPESAEDTSKDRVKRAKKGDKAS